MQTAQYITPGPYNAPALADFPNYDTTLNGKVLSVVAGVMTWSNASATAAAWGTITGTLSSQSDLNTALAAKAPLASPVFTGLPQLPSYAKASLPSATAVGQHIYVSDATGAHKTGSMAFAIATGTGSWVDVTTGNFVA